MTQRRSLYAIASSAGLALALLTGAGTAQAHGNVSWSVGIGSPGVAIGVAAPQPYYYAPPPTYYAPPPPVYYSPPRPVYYAPPVVVAPPGVYVGGGYRHGYRDRGYYRDGRGYDHRRRDWR